MDIITKGDIIIWQHTDVMMGDITAYQFGCFRCTHVLTHHKTPLNSDKL